MDSIFSSIILYLLTCPFFLSIILIWKRDFSVARLVCIFCLCGLSLFFGSMQKIGQIFVDTPLGWLKIQGDENFLLCLSFCKSKGREQVFPLIENARLQVIEYFQGCRKSFSLPLKLSGTPFQCAVWEVLLNIPYGELWSYQRVATCLGNPKAARAVGMANRANPLPILVPCHRVIPKKGGIGGFSSGIWRKAWLIEHEKKHQLLE